MLILLWFSTLQNKMLAISTKWIVYITTLLFIYIRFVSIIGSMPCTQTLTIPTMTKTCTIVIESLVFFRIMHYVYQPLGLFSVWEEHFHSIDTILKWLLYRQMLKIGVKYYILESCFSFKLTFFYHTHDGEEIFFSQIYIKKKKNWILSRLIILHFLSIV